MENKTISDEPLYVMTIELDEGKSSNVKIFLDSKPEELAFDFCKENNLDYSSMRACHSALKLEDETYINSIFPCKQRIIYILYRNCNRLSGN